MVTTNSKDLFELAWSIKDHGKGFDSVFNKKHEKGFRWLHENNGTNWRMLPIQASIGICALDELDNWVKHRQSIANIYNNELKNVKGIRLTIPPSNIIHSYYKYYFFITPEKFQKTRDDIIDLINKENIFCQIGSCGEIYKEKSLCKYQPNYVIKNAQILFETALILKCDPCVTETKAFEDINKIKNILQNNLKAFVD